MSLLALDGVTKRFGGLTAVDTVSLRVEAGEIVGVIGPNGSGKTTLFATVSGFLRPEAGEIRFDGEPIVGLKPSRIAGLGIARTFQVVQPFAGLTVYDNVVAGALRGGRESLADAQRIADEVLVRCGMESERGKLAGALPIVGRKRLEVARALATRPKLLLLDEVMAGLRPVEVDQAIELVRSIRASGVTVVVVEHLMRAVMALAERLYVLDHGALIAHGDPREVIHRPQVVEAYFGKAGHA